MGIIGNLFLVGFAFYQTWIYAAFFTEAPYITATAPDAVRYQVYIESLIFLCIALLAIAVLPFFGKKLSKSGLAWTGAILMAGTVPAMALAGDESWLGIAAVHIAALTSGAGTALLGAMWAICFRKTSGFGIIAFPFVILTEALLILFVQLHPVISESALVAFPLVSAACGRELLRRSGLPPERDALPVSSSVTPSLNQMMGYSAPWLLFGISLGLLIGTSGEGSFARLNDITWLTIVALTAFTVIVATFIVSPAKLFGLGPLVKEAASIPASDKPHEQNRLVSLVCFCAIMALCLFVPLFFGNVVVGDGDIQIGAASSIASFSVMELATLMLFANAAEVFRLPVATVYGMGRAGRVLGVLLGGWLGVVFAPNTSNLPLEQIQPIVMVISCESILVLALYFAVRKSQLGTHIKSRTEIEDACSQLSHQYGLSPREGEVFLLLARGRSQERIQEELHIARSTATTHIHHIYQKLNVHSKQELIDLVESHREKS